MIIDSHRLGEPVGADVPEMVRPLAGGGTVDGTTLPG
jgi:hypothetical protein